MFAKTGIIVASAHGPIGSSVAYTRPSDGRILLRPKIRLTDQLHDEITCKIFQHLDEYYHHLPDEVHDMWNAYAVAPRISGYDAFMSHGLTAMNQGWYAPDLPGEGDGSSPRPVIPGCILPPPAAAPIHPDAKCLVGQARVDVRLDHYPNVIFRYQHSFRDPRFPNPADVACVVLGFWDPERNLHHLRIVGEVGVNYDTGWINTHRSPLQMRMEAFGWYKYFLLDQTFDLPMNRGVAIPQQPAADDGDQEAAHAPFADVQNGNPVPFNLFESIYGYVAWTIVKIERRDPYRWYHLGFDIKCTSRPNYLTSMGTLHLRAIYDKINLRWNWDIRGKLRKIIRSHPGPGIWKPPTHFYKIIRVDNPHWPGVKLSLTWKADSIRKTPGVRREYPFDTAETPVWTRG